MKKVIILKKQKAPHQVRDAIDAIIRDLEIYGRTTTPNGKASRYLSFRMRNQKNKQIYFKWLPECKKSIIALEKGYKLIRLSDNKVKLIYTGELKS